MVIYFSFDCSLALLWFQIWNKFVRQNDKIEREKLLIFFFIYKFIYSVVCLFALCCCISQMEHVIQRERIRILQYLAHYHRSPFHTMNFVHRQIVQHQIVRNIDATVLTSMILTFDNCILKAFDFRALQIELLVCVYARICACNFLFTLALWLFFVFCVSNFFMFGFHSWHSLFVRFHG